MTFMLRTEDCLAKQKKHNVRGTEMQLGVWNFVIKRNSVK